MTDFVKIQDPDKPGDYLVIAKGEFDPAKHRLYSAATEAGPAPAEPEAPDQKKARPRR